MWEWILIVGLYALGMGAFHVFGGLGAAAEAIENWGRASSARHEEQPSPSS
jgi:hypothetical protein